MEKILEILGVSKLEYLNYQRDCYNKWCNNEAKKCFLPNYVFQKNNGLFEWYRSNWKNLESIFLDDFRVYIDEKIAAEATYYNLHNLEVVEPLLGTYPCTLLTKIKEEHYESKLQNKTNNTKEKI